MNLALMAMNFATLSHEGQTRKYTGDPYIIHCAEVAGIVASLPHTFHHPLATGAEMVATAWLHDVTEDCGAPVASLRAMFGPVVAGGVLLLSDLEKDGNRAARKTAQRARLAEAPAWVQSVKCADVISNGRSIRTHDAAFWLTYRSECRLLLDAMLAAHPTLRTMAREVLG